jgi:hypothetical protein
LLLQLSSDKRYSFPGVLNDRRIAEIYGTNSPIAAYAARQVFDLDCNDIFAPASVSKLCKGDGLQHMLGNALLDHDLLQTQIMGPLSFLEASTKNSFE